jgi:hypothetical protein
VLDFWIFGLRLWLIPKPLFHFGFWILDFGFWIGSAQRPPGTGRNPLRDKSKIQNPK